MAHRRPLIASKDRVSVGVQIQVKMQFRDLILGLQSDDTELITKALVALKEDEKLAVEYLKLSPTCVELFTTWGDERWPKNRSLIGAHAAAIVQLLQQETYSNAICRAIIDQKMNLIYTQLNWTDKIDLVCDTLRILSHILQAETSVVKQFLRVFNAEEAAVIKVSRQRKSSSIRSLFVAFIQNLFETKYLAMETFLTKPNGYVAHLFQGYIVDEQETAQLELNILENHVLKNERLSEMHRMQLILCSSGLVTGLMDGLNHEDESFAQMVLDFILRVFLNDAESIFHFNMANISLKEYTTAFKGSEKMKWKVLSSILHHSDATKNLFQQRLILQFVAAFPVLGIEYFQHHNCIMDPRVSYKWISSSSFLCKVLNLPLTKANEQLNLKPQELEPLLILGAGNKKELSRGVMHSEPLVILTTLNTLQAILHRAKILKCPEDIVKAVVPTPEAIFNLAAKYSTDSSPAQALIYPRVLHVIQLCFLVLKKTVQQFRFDMSKIIPPPESIRKLPKDIQVALLGLLSHLDAQRLSALLLRSGDVSMLRIVSLIYLQASRPLLQQLCRTVLMKMMLATGVFSGKVNVTSWLDNLTLEAIPYFEFIMDHAMKNPFENLSENYSSRLGTLGYSAVHQIEYFQGNQTHAKQYVLAVLRQFLFHLPDPNIVLNLTSVVEEPALKRRKPNALNPLQLLDRVFVQKQCRIESSESKRSMEAAETLISACATDQGLSRKEFRRCLYRLNSQDLLKCLAQLLVFISERESDFKLLYSVLKFHLQLNLFSNAAILDSLGHLALENPIRHATDAFLSDLPLDLLLQAIWIVQFSSDQSTDLLYQFLELKTATATSQDALLVLNQLLTFLHLGIAFTRPFERILLKFGVIATKSRAQLGHLLQNHVVFESFANIQSLRAVLLHWLGSDASGVTAKAPLNRLQAGRLMVMLPAVPQDAVFDILAECDHVGKELLHAFCDRLQSSTLTVPQISRLMEMSMRWDSTAAISVVADYFKQIRDQKIDFEALHNVLQQQAAIYVRYCLEKVYTVDDPLLWLNVVESLIRVANVVDVVTDWLGSHDILKSSSLPSTVRIAHALLSRDSKDLNNAILLPMLQTIDTELNCCSSEVVMTVLNHLISRCSDTDLKLKFIQESIQQTQLSPLRLQVLVTLAKHTLISCELTTQLFEKLTGSSDAIELLQVLNLDDLPLESLSSYWEFSLKESPDAMQIRVLNLLGGHVTELCDVFQVAQGLVDRIRDDKELSCDLVELLNTLLDHLKPQEQMQEWIGICLRRYNMSLSLLDQSLFRLMMKLHQLDSDIEIFGWEHYDFRSGISMLLNMDQKTAAEKQLSAEFDWIYSQGLEHARIKASVDHFPKQRCLAAPVSDEIYPNPQVYDPAFMLRLIATLVQSSQVERKFVQHGLLAYTLAATTSEDLPVRQVAFGILGQVLEVFSGDSRIFYEQRQVCSLLEAFKYGISSPYPQLASIWTIFAHECLSILLKPAHVLYKPLNRFLLSRPGLDLDEVPMFYVFFNSNTTEYKMERVWILNLLRRGLVDALDVEIYKSKHVFSILMSFMLSDIADDCTRELTMQVLVQAASIDAGKEYLIQELGLMNWLDGVFRQRRNTMEVLKAAIQLLQGQTDTICSTSMIDAIVDRARACDLETVVLPALRILTPKDVSEPIAKLLALTEDHREARRVLLDLVDDQDKYNPPRLQLRLGD